MRIKRPINIIMAILTISAALILASCPNDPAPTDTTSPVINSMVPLDNKMDVSLNTTINATFSEEMDAATIVGANFTVMAGTTPVAGTVSYDAAARTASFDATGNLAVSTEYVVTVSDAVKDTAGNLLESTSWSFTTGNGIDTGIPTVVQVYPADAASGLEINTIVEAFFSEGMDIATINTSNFTLTNGATVVGGTVTYNVLEKKAIFAPATNLAYGTVYTATVKTGAKDTSGNALAADEVWSFTTIASADVNGPAPVHLGTAANFVILAKTAITTVPDSAITGDIGLSPAAESYMTGFSQTKATGYSTSLQVDGFMYAADMTPPTPSNMTVAIGDMETAYVDAAGRSLSAVNNLGAGTIGGLSFVPGLYHWGSNVLVTTDITLNGDANDVWIFQSTGNLVVSSGVEILLAGGALAKNVFWQVAGYAQLGTGSIFRGNILCQTQINVQTGASVSGRLLAQTQVTLQQNAVSYPTP